MLEGMSSNSTTIIDALQHVDQAVTVNGWVHTIRDMGKIAFIELRDHTGLLQVVVDDPSKLPKLGAEYVVRVRGTVRKRGERYTNDKLATGTIELGAESVELINASQELPFEVKKDTADVHEELRLKYRYLDLRSQRMAANLRLRHRVTRFIRNYLEDEGFISVETPHLTKGTPEGAREFLVPSRLHPERFYVLPQSPQQFKQLLMVGGVGRYYQVVKCMRDEDQRLDRQPEFTQVDIEMSFITQEEIMQLNEAMMIALVREEFPEKRITTAPFPRLTYAEAMERYNSDKPDLRNDKSDNDELAFAWVTDFPMFDKGEESGKIEAMHHPFTSPRMEDIPLLDSEPFKVRANAYDLVLNGFEVSGGSIRINQADLLTKVFQILGLEPTEIEGRFGHMLEAFKYGTPPHGGIAYGFDRLVMILAGEPNIREVIAFPKTGDARDPLTGAPAAANPTALSEAHIQTVAPKRRS
jgi:aspartyl-tRNA synthetase